MSDEIKKGLVGVISDETKVSKVMPEINSLTYRAALEDQESIHLRRSGQGRW